VAGGQVERYGHHSYCIMLFDIDFFKIYESDHYGHCFTGDAALRTVKAASPHRCAPWGHCLSPPAVRVSHYFSGQSLASHSCR